MNDEPRIKLSEDVAKITIPGKKEVYRFYGADGNGLVDVLMSPSEQVPLEAQRLLIRNPFIVSLQSVFTTLYPNHPHSQCAVISKAMAVM